MGVEIHMATQDDLRALVDDLSAGNRGEYERGGYEPIEVLATVMSRSHSAFAVRCNGKILALFGVRNDTPEEALAFGVVPPEDGKAARVWASVAAAAENHSLALAKESLVIRDTMLRHYSVLYSLVDSEYTRSVRWLEWLGFRRAAEIIQGDRRSFLVELRR